MATYDYIIIGGGSAGCLLANRLSQDPRHHVCLIEAGRPDNSPLIDIPIGVVNLIAKDGYNWCYDTAPQKHLNGRSLYWPRGKTLGGSSAINGMVYVRGNPRDFDEWAELGAHGWSWQDMLPHFIAHEDNCRWNGELHGQGGELHVGDPANSHPLAKRFCEAAAQAGLPENTDFNGIGQEGYGRFQVTLKNGRRISAARAFLDPIKSRPNLTIITESVARKINFVGNTAISVEVQRKEDIEMIFAAGEIILCGGAVNSPQLLMLSGIGPKKDLETVGVGVIHDLPDVGKNLQDHLGVGLSYKDRSRTAPGLGLKTPFAMIRAYFQYRSSGTGLFATTTEVGAFTRLSQTSDRPDIQYHFMPGLVKDHGRKAVWGYGVTLNCCQLHPKSRGYITLRSRDPAVAPLIQPNYLSHDEDLQVLLAAVKAGREIMDSPAMKMVTGGTDLGLGNGPVSDEQLVEYIKQTANSIYHPVGTCRMGSDSGAVVDTKLRVSGVNNLRVADASVMPTITSGNTNAPTLAIAEKAARLILESC